MPILSDITHPFALPRREFAHFGGPFAGRFVSKFSTGTVISMEDEPSNSNPPYCQHRYPSPCRPVHCANRPTHYRWWGRRKSANHRHTAYRSVEFLPKPQESRTIGTTTEIGTKCGLKLGSLQRSQPLGWPVAWTRTANALLSGPGRALSRLTSSAQIAQGQRFLGLPLVHSATTQACAVRLNTSPFGALSIIVRRWGFSPAAVFRAGEYRHV